MFKTQKSVLLTGLVIYALYIWGFGVLFGSLEFSWAFYFLAVLLGLGFYAFVSDYYPKTEAFKMSKSPSTSARYIEDGPYSRASVCAILMLLLSITPLLITVSLNQRGICDISWFWQALIFLGGYALQYVTLSIYKGCDSISIDGHLWYCGLGTRSSSLSSEEVQDKIDRVTEVSVSQKDRDQAKIIVIDILVQLLGIQRSEITTGASKLSDLGVDELMMLEIVIAIDEYLQKKYGHDTYEIEHNFRETSLMRQYIDCINECVNNTVGNRNYSNSKDKDKEAFRKYRATLSRLLQTVQDLYDLVAESIFYIRTKLN
jgi:acyl carrier protein